MAGEEIYIARLGAWIARAVGETAGFGSDLDTNSIGFSMPEAVTTDPAVAAAGAALTDAGTQLYAAADALDTVLASGVEEDLPGPLIQLAQGIFLYVDAIAELVQHIESAASGLPADERNAVEAFAGEMARRVIDLLAIQALERALPRTGFVLRLLGLLEWKLIEVGTVPGQPTYARKRLRLERIKDLFTDPAQHFENAFGWGTAQFDPMPVFDAMLPFYHPDASVVADYDGGDAFLRIGNYRWSRDSSVAGPPALRLEYSAEIQLDYDERVELSEEWGIGFDSGLKFGGGLAAIAEPPFAISVEPLTGNAEGRFTVSFDRNPGQDPLVIVGGNDLIRISADNFAIGAELTVGASTSGAVDIDPGVFSNLEGLTIKLGSEGADNFLADMLSSAEIEGSFDLGLSYRLSEGLVVRAAGGLEVAIPMQQSLGPVTFETLYIILKIGEDGSFALETSAAIKGAVGPFSASVERIGAEVTLAFAEGADADFGPFDLGLGFKPPNGVGLALDAGLVRGGGYLYLDYDRGEYAGALELTFQGFLSVKAIGLINTQLPDGSDGFSLLVLVTAEFGTPIQLGFGFTLNGIGGLLGLNRTMMLEEMAEGVRSGAIESVMFPQDVIANAPQIISDMKRFFPPKENRFIIGPMVKIGWGTPSLITASVGIVIEIPPGNIAILGVIKCALPDEDAALLVLQVKFIGAIEPEKERLWFFASLYGSRVLFITLDGDMGLLIAWGANADFVLSVGGFHPQFSPPPLPFPSPARISLSILDTSFAKIKVSGYFAVTANTAQFGAAVELFFGLDALKVEGHIGFDALFQFSPFYFIITFSASLSVKVFGIGLFSVRIRGQLEGTSPWHIEGEGSISLLFFDISVPISETWGEDADTVVPSIEAMPVIRAELEKTSNWTALLPSASQISVSLREIEASTELVLHPVGQLRVAQRAVPLDLVIDKIGAQPVDDITRAVLTPGAGLARTADVRESFATAQFREMDGAAKLASPGYELQDGGLDLSVDGSEAQTSHAVKRPVMHELNIIDNNFKHHLLRFFNIGVHWFGKMLVGNATARSALSKIERQRKNPFDDGVRVTAPGWVVANASDNVIEAGEATFLSQAKAKDAMAAQLGTNPALNGKLHVIPAAEARKAA